MLSWPTNRHLLLSYYFSSSCSRSQPYLPHLSQHNKYIWASKSTNIMDAAVLIWVESQAHMAKATLTSLLLCTTNIKAITKHLCKQHILRLQQCKCLFCG